MKRSSIRRPGPLAALLALLVLALAVPGTAHAKPQPGAKARGFRLFARTLGAMAVNRVYCGIDAQKGNVCVDSSGSSTIGGGFWPKGTPDQYVFNSGLQLAGVISNPGGAWDKDTTGAFFFDPKGTTEHGDQVQPVYNALNADDVANWPDAARVPQGDASETLFNPTLRGSISASQGDVWFLTWDGNPTLIAGRPHPLGVLVESRLLGWNQSGLEDLFFYILTFYNVTSSDCTVYATARPAMQPILCDLGTQFVQRNSAAFNVTLPTAGYTISDLYAAFSADNDVADAGINYSSVNLPFALGYTYEESFDQPPGWIFPPALFGAPFFPGAGFIGVKYLRSPSGPGEIQLFSNTTNGGAFPDAQDVRQLWRFLSGRLDSRDRACNNAPQGPLVNRVCFINQAPSDSRFFQSSTPLALAPGEFKSIVVAYLFAAPVKVGTPVGPGTDIKPADPLRLVNPSLLGANGGSANVVDSLTGFKTWSDANQDGEVQQNEFGVVAGSLLDKALLAQAVFETGFLLPQAPTAPEFYLVPGNNQVTVLWRASASETNPDAYFQVTSQPTALDEQGNTIPNTLYDPNYRQFDVEGYRIYRGRVDNPDALKLVAQFDYSGTSISDFSGAINPTPGCAPELNIQDDCAITFDPIVAGVARTAHVDYPLVGPILQVVVKPGGTPARQALLNGGTILTKVDTLITGNGTGNPELSDTGVPFVYIDRDVRNNFRYFYVVTAFDVNSAANGGPSSLESTKGGTKAVTPVPGGTNEDQATLSFGLFGDDGVQLNPDAPFEIDPNTGVFLETPPPTNGVAAAFAPLVPALLPALNLEAKIDSIRAFYSENAKCGGVSNALNAVFGVGVCMIYYVSFTQGPNVSRFTVVSPYPYWTGFGDPAQQDAALGQLPITPDDTNATKFGVPTNGQFRTANAGVGITQREAIDFSSLEGQAARRGLFSNNNAPGQCGNTSNCASAISVGGSRWFAGANETRPHPTVGIAVGGGLPGADSVWAPIHHVDPNPGNAVAEVQPNNAVSQVFTYGFAMLSREADVQLTWGANGQISLRDVTHHLPVNFNTSAHTTWGVVRDGDNNGVINFQDFAYIPNVAEWASNVSGQPAPVSPADTVQLTNVVTVQPVRFSQATVAKNTPATGQFQGFGLYVNGERYIFALTGGQLPPAGTVWTLRTYTGRVRASTNLNNSLTPGGYQFTPYVRSPNIEGLKVVFSVPNATRPRATVAADVANVHTVPDPYYVTNGFEQTTDNKILKFVNLPSPSVIRIYSASGVLVQVLTHTDGTSTETWNLRNRNNQTVASGVYFYHVESGSARKVGRFTIVNFAQ